MTEANNNLKVDQLNRLVNSTSAADSIVNQYLSGSDTPQKQTQSSNTSVDSVQSNNEVADSSIMTIAKSQNVPDSSHTVAAGLKQDELQSRYRDDIVDNQVLNNKAKVHASSEMTPWLDYLVKNRGERQKSASEDNVGKDLLFNSHGDISHKSANEKPQLLKRYSSINEESPLIHAGQLQDQLPLRVAFKQDSAASSQQDMIKSSQTNSNSNPQLARKSYMSPSDKSQTHASRRNVISMSSADPIEQWKRSLDTGLTQLDSAVDPSINSFKASGKDLRKPVGWNVKIYESHALTVDIPEYKTLFVHPEATVLELLALSLKKWRCINPTLVSDLLSKGPRAQISQALKDTIDQEGWQLLLVTSDKLKFQVAPEPLPLNLEVCEILKSAPQDVTPSFSFRKMLLNAESLVSDYLRSSCFEPCYLYKLNSSYPQTLLNEASSPAIDIKHWTRRYVLVARNRYLLFFKSENHSKWRQNLLHEIDLGKVVSVDSYEHVCIGENGQPRGYGVRIKTRTRVIYLCVDTEAERVCVVNQLQEIQRTVAVKRASITNPHIQALKNSTQRQTSFGSVISTGGDQKLMSVSPMQQLVLSLESSRRLNAVDLPPFDMALIESSKSGLPKELQSWAMATNQSLFSTLRELVISKLLYLIDKDNLKDFAEAMQPVLKDVGLLDGYRLNAGAERGDQSANMMSTMKKMFKGWSADKDKAQIIQSSQSIPGQATPMLFGTALEELSVRYDTTGLGLPTMPPIVKQSVAFISEKGLHLGGIFRIAGSVKRMELLKKAFEKADLDHFQKYQNSMIHTVIKLDKQTTETVSSSVDNVSDSKVDFASFTVHDVAGVLKWFIRDLPEPLLSSRLYRSFIAIDKLKDQSELQFKLLHHLVMLLPAINRHMLQILLAFMNHIQMYSEDKALLKGQDPPVNATIEDGIIKGNLMTSSNLAVVMGPNILRDSSAKSDDSKKDSPASSAQTQRAHRNSISVAEQDERDLSDSSAVVNIVKLMIDRHEELFVIPQELMSELKAVAGANVIQPVMAGSASAFEQMMPGSSTQQRLSAEGKRFQMQQIQ